MAPAESSTVSSRHTRSLLPLQLLPMPCESMWLLNTNRHNGSTSAPFVFDPPAGSPAVAPPLIVHLELIAEFQLWRARKGAGAWDDTKALWKITRSSPVPATVARQPKPAIQPLNVHGYSTGALIPLSLVLWKAPVHCGIQCTQGLI